MCVERQAEVLDPRIAVIFLCLYDVRPVTEGQNLEC